MVAVTPVTAVTALLTVGPVVVVRGVVRTRLRIVVCVRVVTAVVRPVLRHGGVSGAHGSSSQPAVLRRVLVARS